ncbi:hypothetical protein [Nocardia tengchongensis]|uniref:hypothetical protein n=1 Tax=Nocardia tengchongensis TaxID=2055889 RepID=UPI0036215C81
MSAAGETAPHLDRPDPRVLGLSWDAGTVRLVLDKELVLTISPEVAAWLAAQARVCLHAALKADPTATAGGFVHELLTGDPHPRLTEDAYRALTGGGATDGNASPAVGGSRAGERS